MIEQAGSPREVFNRPATAFIARFIGGHNIVSDASGSIAVRTDRLRLSKTTGGAARTAVVSDVEYQGSYVQIGLEADFASDLTANLSEAVFDAEPLNPGDTVAVSWNEADVHRLAAA